MQRFRPGPTLIGAMLVFAGVSQAQSLTQPSPSHEVRFQYSTPEVGGALFRTGNGQLRFSTFSSGSSPEASASKRCPVSRWVDIPLVSDGWLKLSFSTLPDQRAMYVNWLDERSEAIDLLTNREVLQRAWRGLKVGFDALSAGTRRPGEVAFVVRMTPADCVYVEEHSFTAQQSRRSITFPVAIHSPGFVGPASTRLTESIVEIAAHETTHALNLYPFNQDRLDWLRRSPPVAPHDPTKPTSMDAEVRAVSVERCLRRMIMPRSIEMEADAIIWRDNRQGFDSKVSDEPTWRIWGETYQREYDLVGARFVDIKTDDELQSLLGRCALYLQRRAIVDGSTVPNNAEKAAAARALHQIRQTTAPIRFQGRVYDY